MFASLREASGPSRSYNGPGLRHAAWTLLRRSADYPTPQMRARGVRCGCRQYWEDPCRAEFRSNLIASMDAQGVDALVYPTWSSPPRALGDDADADRARLLMSGTNSAILQPDMLVRMPFLYDVQGG